jgi:hypothetical protein
MEASRESWVASSVPRPICPSFLTGPTRPDIQPLLDGHPHRGAANDDMNCAGRYGFTFVRANSSFAQAVQASERRAPPPRWWRIGSRRYYERDEGTLRVILATVAGFALALVGETFGVSGWSYLFAGWTETARRSRPHPSTVVEAGSYAAQNELHPVTRALQHAPGREGVLVDDVPSHDHARPLKPSGEPETFPSPRQRDALHRASDDRHVCDYPSADKRLVPALSDLDVGVEDAIAFEQETVGDDRVGVDRHQRIPLAITGPPGSVVRRSLPGQRVGRSFEHFGARGSRRVDGEIGKAVSDDDVAVAPSLSQRRHGAPDQRLLVARRVEHEQTWAWPNWRIRSSLEERRHRQHREVDDRERAPDSDHERQRNEQTLHASRLGVSRGATTG